MKTDILAKTHYRKNDTEAYKNLTTGLTNHIQHYLYLHPEVRPYLTTFRFDNIPTNNSYCPYQYKFLTTLTWNFYHRVYYHLSSSLTNNITRKPNLFPRTYDFLDIDHTDKSKSVTFTETTIPHIHSVYLIHTDLVGRFEEHIDNQFQSITNSNIFAEHIRTIDARKITNDLPFVVSYASKFYDNYQARIIRDKDGYDLYHMFPLGRSELETLKRSHTDKRNELIQSSNVNMRELFRSCRNGKY